MPPVQTADTPNQSSAGKEETGKCTLARSGRQMTWLVDMFWSIDDMLLFSKKWYCMSVNDQLAFEESVDKSKLCLLALLVKFIELEPKTIETLCQGLGEGESNGHLEDMRKAQEELPQWEKFDPLLGPNATRGLSHQCCAYYLSTPEMDWNNEAIITCFMTYALPAMGPSDWPWYFWPGGVCNLKRLSEGLLRGELLIKVAISILLSCASARLLL
ncbi:hypothetical protein BN14_10085 [Rhizoctonia solani AG-1 IB]|uniref:Uncharacterized protein n=1 Tax=Thanatephorus cucumeris (strain AG1-IB / isolate 7/3/14) TaxID=1108050 RepID=M5C7M3_THACB|nr:hypothetical protein BN14_10085 [Rhizoctonia solani AG-1 IB]